MNPLRVKSSDMEAFAQKCFANRHELQAHLAREAQGGVLVEVGVGPGNGLRALCEGDLPVYGIDPWEPFVDQLGASWGEEDGRRCLANLAEWGLSDRAGLIEYRAEDVAVWWDVPVALLWIDISETFEVLRELLDAWERHIVPGGAVAIAGLAYEQLGTAQAADHLQAVYSYEWEVYELSDAVAVLRKPGRHGD